MNAQRSQTMVVGTAIMISGFVTKEKFVRGRTLAELERLLGYGAGRLSRGLIAAKPLVLPALDGFETKGYSQVPGHRYRQPSGLDNAVVRRLARQSWSMAGPESLVKFLPFIRHSDAAELDEQYPPGAGIPQWRIPPARKLPGKVVAVVTAYPGGRYV